MIIEGTGSYCVSNLLHLREKYCLSRRGLARLIRMSEYKLRDIEEGRRVPAFRLEEIRRICAVFGISVEQLFEHDLTGKTYRELSKGTKQT